MIFKLASFVRFSHRSNMVILPSVALTGHIEEAILDLRGNHYIIKK